MPRAASASVPGMRHDHGDRIGGGSKVTGSDTGFKPDRVHGHRQEGALHDQLVLSRGEISAQGLVPNTTRPSPIVITGGTGA